MGKRGAALPVVLAIITLVLVIGFAMGALSTLSLQFSQRQTEEAKIELAIQSTVSKLLAHLQVLVEKQNLNPLDPKPLEIEKEFPSGLTNTQNEIKVWLTFNPQEQGYSTNNLTGDVPAAGWPDKDGKPRAAPFTLDVILNAQSASGITRYRVGIRQVWPYAVYTNGGPILLMSKSNYDPNSLVYIPSLVNGNLFTSWTNQTANSAEQNTNGHGLGLIDSPSKLIAFIDSRNGRHPIDPLTAPLTLNVDLRLNPPIGPLVVRKASTPAEQFIYYDNAILGETWNTVSDDPMFSASNAARYGDSGSAINGYFYYNSKSEDDITQESLIHGEGAQNIPIIKRRKLSSDPLAIFRQNSGSLLAGFDSTNFQKVHFQPGDYEDLKNVFEINTPTGKNRVIHYDNQNSKAPYFLDEDLILSETENSSGGPLSTHYEIDGSLTNRQLAYDETNKMLFVRQSRKGIQLQNVVLHVKGDLDLGSINPGPPGGVKVKPLTITGSSATLIVDGKLTLGEAMLNANDQNFVICAKSIVLKIGGDFRGLMLAQDYIAILTNTLVPLNIHGALLCSGAGGITLFGTTVEHDPRYLKSINSGGDFQIVSWQKL